MPSSCFQDAGRVIGGNLPVVQNSGSVVYRVDGRTNKHFQVVTPYLVAGVKGTTFRVTVREGLAAVTVEEGRVEVASRVTGATVSVGAGESVILEAG